MAGLRRSLTKRSTKETLYRIICALTIASLLLSLVGTILPPPTAQAAVIQAPPDKSTPTATASSQPTASATTLPTTTTGPTAVASPTSVSSPSAVPTSTTSATAVATIGSSATPTASTSATPSATSTATTVVTATAATVIATATATGSPTVTTTLTATATASPTPAAASGIDAYLPRFGQAGGKLQLVDFGELVIRKGILSADYRLGWNVVEPRLARGLRRFHPADQALTIGAFNLDGTSVALNLKSPASLSLKIDRFPARAPAKPAVMQQKGNGWATVNSAYGEATQTLSVEVSSLPVTLAVVDSSQPALPAADPDPTDPSALQLPSGHWVLAAVDGSGNVIFQKTVIPSSSNYWTAPSVVEYSATAPAMVRFGTTLALFYAKSDGTRLQVFVRTSADDGATWSSAVQVSQETASPVYQVQAVVVGSTVYAFWSLNVSVDPGVVNYATSTDLSTWSAASSVGQAIGISSSETRPWFDVKHLASGAWALTWVGGADYSYPAVWAATSTDLGSTSWSSKQEVEVSGFRCIGCLRWPQYGSLAQASTGTVYIASTIYDWPSFRGPFYRTSPDDAATWTPTPGNDPYLFGDNGGANAYLAPFGTNGVRAFWDLGGLLYFRDLSPSVGSITQVVVGTPPLPVETAPATQMALLPAHKVRSFDPVITINGAYTYSHTDLAIPGRGPSPSFTRYYNSGDDRVGVLGPGWTHNYAIRLTLPSQGSQDVQLVEADGHTSLYTYSSGAYQPPAGVTSTLVKNGDGSYAVTHRDQTAWSFDATGKLTRITDRYGNYSELRYNGTTGRLETITDSLSSQDTVGRGSISLAYDGNGRLHTVTDWAGRVVTYEYDASGRLWKVWDRENIAGPAATFAYDGTSQRLVSITDANGHVAVTNHYDASGRVDWQKDARGLTTGQQTTFSYTTNPDGSKVTAVTYPATSYEPSWYPQVIDYFDTAGLPQKRVSKPTSNGADDVTVEYGYDSAANLIWTKDGRGNQTDLCYDVDYTGAAISGSKGNLTRRIDPAPTAGGNRPVTLFQYDAKNNLIQTVSPKGVPSGTAAGCTDNYSSFNSLYATDSAYDASGVQLLSVTRRFSDPDLGAQTATTKFEYGDSANPGLVTKIIPPRGNTGGTPDYTYATTMAYYGSGNKAGMLASTTDPLGNLTTYDYDSVGRRVSMVDPNGNAAGGVPSEHTWSYQYDNEDRLRFTRAPAPTPGGSQISTEYRYDAVGNRTVVMDANGQVTKYLYDERDSLKEVHQSDQPWTDPGVTPNPDLVTAYQYDNAGNLARVIRASGDSSNERTTDYAYDGLARVRKETQYPSWPATTPTLVTQYTYDLAGNRRTLVDPLGQTTTFSYDNLNRLTLVDYSDAGTSDVSYEYDAEGNRTQMTDGTGQTLYSYDEAGRLLSVTSPGPKIVGYRYDLDGNRTKVIYPDTTAVTYTFDKGSRLASLSDWTNRQVSYSYYPDGSVREVANFNGTAAAFSYDNALRLTEVHNQEGTNTLTRHTYILDAVGNRTQVDEVLAPLGSQGVAMSSGAQSMAVGVEALSQAAVAPLADAPTPPRPDQRQSPGKRKPVAPSSARPDASSTSASSGDTAGDSVYLPEVPGAAPSAPSGASGRTKVGAAPSASVSGAADATSVQPGTWDWGDDWYGQLGDGSTTNRNAPRQVSVTSVAAVGAGENHTLAVKADGTVWAWGWNIGGQLGDGTATDRPAPVQVSGLTGVTAVAGGTFHSLALKSDGTVWSWGFNGDGQLGDGTTDSHMTPVQVSGLTGITAIAAGGSHNLALKSDGTVWAWGYNGNGQLGDGSTTSRYAPVQVSGLTGATAIAAGLFHSLAVKGNDSVWAWGFNGNGQLGDGTTTQHTSPAQVTGLGGFSAASGGSSHSLALKSDGSVYAWGWNGYGQLGDGTNTERHTPVQLTGIGGVSAIGTRSYHSLAFKADGTAWSWGWGAYGQLGTSDRYSQSSPQQVGGLSAVSAVRAGNRFSLAMKTDGTASLWGDDWFGQLGDGTTTNRGTPLQVGITGATSSAGGSYSSSALKTDGTVWTWGQNAYGQLGDGSYTDHYTPVQVSGLSSVRGIASGWIHVLALKQDGTIWGWGYGGDGELGDGSGGYHPTPVQASGLSSVSVIGAGTYHSLAARSDGTAWAWGWNIGGQLGDNTTSDRWTPVQVQGVSGVVSLAGGDYHSLALKGDGTVWAWGWNGNGQLGDGTTTQHLTAVQVSGLTGVTAIAAAGSASYALKSDGTVWAWGWNGDGQLGDGSTTERHTPVQVSGLSGVSAISAGGGHAYALKGDGTVWSWGDNTYGELGEDSRTGHSTPVQVLSPAGITGIGAGYDHGLAVTAPPQSTTASYTYDYDRLYRLKGVSGSGSASYAYDPVGNRSTKVSTSYAYDRADRITSVGGMTYSVNANGNLVTRGSDSFTYDQANRLKTASVSGTVSSYVYDGDGKRASKIVGGSTSGYVYDVNASLPVLLDDGTRKYVWGLGLAFAVDSLGNTSVYHADGLGSVRALTDASGTIVQTYLYDEYGAVLSSQGSITQPFQHAGEQSDETGFMYLRARMYDPGSGRFTSRDTESGRTDVPSTLNRYSYVANNPVLLTDPSGLTMIAPCKAQSGGVKEDAASTSLLSIFDPCKSMTSMPPVFLGVSTTPAGVPITAGVFAFKTFEALKNSLGNVGPTHAWHHIVEQRQANLAKFGAEAIQSTANIIKLSSDVHTKVSSYYSSTQTTPLGDMVFRRYVGTLPFEEQFQEGVRVLRMFGVSI